MHSKARFANVIFDASRRPKNGVLAILLMLLVFIFLFVFLTLIAQPAQGQSFRVIYSFTGGQDGAAPNGHLTINAVGDLYGTNYLGGTRNYGTAFKLKRSGSGWVLLPLHEFMGLRHMDGAVPWAGVAFGPDGNLYGTTDYGGGGATSCECGMVFSLKPSESTGTGWTESLLYSFSGGRDGNVPASDVVFDREGNLYSTTVHGGGHDVGTVFKLTPSRDGWTETVLYRFIGGSDGGQPMSGVILDGPGNVYGTSIGIYSGHDWGNVYKLTPSGDGWIQSNLYNFQAGDDGAEPCGGLIWDGAGNLYGTTTGYGAGNGGSVFMLSQSNGSWRFTVLYTFTGGFGPTDSLVMDAAGNLYGATSEDGIYGLGNIFKLTPFNGGWTYTSLYDFTGGNDGKWPARRAGW